MCLSVIQVWVDALGTKSEQSSAPQTLHHFSEFKLFCAALLSYVICFPWSHFYEDKRTIFHLNVKRLTTMNSEFVIYWQAALKILEIIPQFFTRFHKHYKLGWKLTGTTYVFNSAFHKWEQSLFSQNCWVMCYSSEIWNSHLKRQLEVYLSELPNKLMDLQVHCQSMVLKGLDSSDRFGRGRLLPQVMVSNLVLVGNNIMPQPFSGLCEISLWPPATSSQIYVHVMKTKSLQIPLLVIWINRKRRDFVGSHTWAHICIMCRSHIVLKFC